MKMNKGLLVIALGLLVACTKDDESVYELPVCFEINQNSVFDVGHSITATNCTEVEASYKWFVNDFEVSTETNLNVLLVREGVNTIRLKATDAKGRTGQSVQQIQVGPYKVKEFAMDGDVRHEPFYMIKTADNGYLLEFGLSTAGSPASSDEIVKFDENLNSTWTISHNTGFITNRNGGTLFENAGGNFLNTHDTWISGNSTSMKRIISSAGASTESSNLSNEMAGTVSYLVKGDSIIYVGYMGSNTNYRLMLRITDHTGTDFSILTIPMEESNLMGSRIIRNSIGFLVLTATSGYQDVSYRFKPRLFQLDKEFNVLWSKEIEMSQDAFYDMRNWEVWPHSAGGYLVMADGFFARVDDSGNVLSVKTLNDPNYRRSWAKVLKHENNYLVLNKANLFYVDENLNIIWSMKSEDSYKSYYIGLVDSSHFVVAYIRSFPSPTYNNKIVFEKIDYDGNYMAH